MRGALLGLGPVWLLVAAAASAQPANDTCLDARPIPGLPFAEQIDASGATNDLDDPTTCASLGSGASVWYVLDVPADGLLNLATVDSDYDTVLSVYEGTCGALLERACNDDYGPARTSLLDGLPVLAGEHLLIRIGAFAANAAGTLVLTAVLNAPSNDECTDAIEIQELPFFHETTNLGADRSPREPIGEDGICDFSATLWYRFTPDRDGVIVVDTAGSTFDTVLAAWAGECVAPELLTCNDDSLSLQANLGVPVTANVPVSFEVGGYAPYDYPSYEKHPEIGALQFHVAWAPSPGNDLCLAASPVALPATIEQYVPGATRDDAPASACGSGSASVWYEIVPTTGGVLSIDTTGSDYDTVLDVFSGSCDAPLFRDCNDDGPVVASSLALGVADGEHVLVAASAYAGGAGGNLVLNASIQPCVQDYQCAHPNRCIEGTCALGACTFAPVPGCCVVDAECDDGDPCTANACAENECAYQSSEGLDLATCRLLDDPATCPPDALREGLRRGLERRFARAAELRTRAEGSTKAATRERLLRRMSGRIRAALRKLNRAVGRGRATPECAGSIRDAFGDPDGSAPVLAIRR